MKVNQPTKNTMNYYIRNTRISLSIMLAVALTAFIGLTMPGCTTIGDNPGAVIDNNPIASKVVFQIATVRYIDGDLDKQSRVIEYLDYIEYVTGGESTAYTVEHVSQSLKNEIDWSKITPAETILVLNLIDGVSAYVAYQIEDRADIIDAQALVTVRQVTSWIREAALLTPMQATAIRAEMGATTTAPNIRTVRRQDLVGHIFNLQEPAPLTPEEIDRARKLRALMHATDPETGIVNGETYRALAQ